MNHVEEFRTAMAAHGMNYAGPLKDDGALHRFSCEDSDSNSCWYVLHPPDPISAGAFGCWRRQIDEKWRSGNGQVDPRELGALRKKWQEADSQRARDDAARHERMAVKAVDYIAQCKLVTTHNYLDLKKVQPTAGLRVNGETELVMSLQDVAGRVWSYQTIDPIGCKLFMPGGRVRGCYHLIGKMDEGPVVICEGYATGATIHQATGWPVCCAMNCGNLKDVCVAIRKEHPDSILVVGADDDRFTENNPGMSKARAAADAVRALLAIPEFPTDCNGTDFNDLAVHCSEQIVRAIFFDLLGMGMGQRITIKELLSFVPDEDKDSVLGKRYLCRGGSCVVVGQTSAGKSSLGLQMAVMWALGQPFFGLKPARPLRSLYVQAENDIGDTAEMLQGILLGLGIVSETDPEQNAAITRILDKNLIIIRDQTHIGPGFPSYASKLVELHKPDVFWIDPLLSFYGDDINDQRAMSLFLRANLNPISERTGIIWMLMHHTGKPQKDASKQQKNWSARDFAYMGLGSSELSNWARAIITVVNSNDDEFRVVFAKRGWRAGIVDDRGNPCTELNLAHSGDYICWRQIPKPKAMEEMDDSVSVFARSLAEGELMTATAIVKSASEKLQRGERTCWKMWDGGEGILGVHFVMDGNLWKRKIEGTPKPYKDD